MPSGARRRKAAKKKQQKKETPNNGAHPQGNEEPKSHDERESDGGEAEREPSEEGTVENQEEVAKEVSLEEEIATEIAREVKEEEVEEKLNDDVTVEAEDVALESRNGDASDDPKISCIRASEDEEVAVEKENPIVSESVGEEHQLERSFEEAVAFEKTPKPIEDVTEENLPEEVPSENSTHDESIQNSTEESIPVEESVKEVVPLPSEPNVETESVVVENATPSETVESEFQQVSSLRPESNVMTESVVVVENAMPTATNEPLLKQVVSLPPESTAVTETVVVENAMPNETNESELKQKVEEVLSPSEEKDKISTPVVVEKVETTVIEVVERVPQKLPLPENVDVTSREDGETAVARNGGGDHVKDSEMHKNSDEQPMVLPLRRTSWTGCCGLFEVFSGGSRR